MKVNRTQFKEDLKTFLSLVILFTGLVALLSLAACAPSRTERKYKAVRTDFNRGPTDPVLTMKPGPEVIDPSRLSWSGDASTAVVLRLSRSLIELGNRTGRKNLTGLGQRMGREFYSTSGLTTRSEFQQTLYVSAAIGETRTDSAKTLSDADAMLGRQMEIVDSTLKSLGAEYPWPKSGASDAEMIDTASDFVQRFVTASDGRLDPKVHKSVVKALKERFDPILKDARASFASIMNETSTVRLLAGMKDLIARNDFHLDADTETKILWVERIAGHIDVMKDKYDALSVLVWIWQMLTPEERIANIKPKSAALYDYLNGKSDKDLACIADRKCSSLIKILQKDFGLYPAIEKYGVENLQRDLSGAILDGVKVQIRAEIVDLLPKLPGELSTRILKEFSDLRTKVRSIETAYGPFVRSVAQSYAQDAWTAKGESTQVPGFEAEKMRVDIRPGRIDFAAKQPEGSVDTGAETIGTSLGLAGAIWSAGVDPQDLNYQKSVISQVNKLLAIGGFKTENDDRFKSLSISLDPLASQRHFYIRDFMKVTQGYAVPDHFRAAPDMSSTAGDEKAFDVSVKAQAELLRGLSAMIKAFRDFETGPFDAGLGKVQVGKFIKEIPAESVDAKLFPKDTFFALAVGNASAILENLTRKNSAVFVVNAERETKWSDEMKGTDEIAAKAGIVDVVGGVRASQAKTADIARYLIAVADFLDATEGAEKTKSEPLTKVGSTGKRPIDTLLEARKDLRLLVVGLANFLSNEMQEADGGFRSTFSRKTTSVDTSEPRTLLDQALGLQALERAGEIIDSDLYRSAARNALVFMNAHLWDSEKGFYSVKEGAYEEPSLGTIVQVLTAGEEIRPFLEPQSQTQWDRIASPWYNAFDRL